MLSGFKNALGGLNFNISKTNQSVKLARFSGSLTSSQIWVEVRLPNIRLSGGFDGIYVITAQNLRENDYFGKISDFDAELIVVVG